MKAQLTINIKELNLDTYETSALFTAGVAGHTVDVQLFDIPKDQTPTVERLNKQIQEWRNIASTKENQMYEWQNKYQEKVEEVNNVRNDLTRQLAEAQRASTESEDRPRPGLPNETLLAVLTLMRQDGRDHSSELSQVQIVRLLTGWNVSQSEGFVRSARS